MEPSIWRCRATRSVAQSAAMNFALCLSERKVFKHVEHKQIKKFVVRYGTSLSFEHNDASGAHPSKESFPRRLIKDDLQRRWEEWF